MLAEKKTSELTAEEINETLVTRLRDCALGSDLWRDDYRDRFDVEIKEIANKEVAGEYLQMVKEGRKIDKDCYLIAYLIGIADSFDPESSLPADPNNPDIDSDFESRKEIVEWMEEEYGKGYVVYINNYSEYKGKSALKDVQRVYSKSFRDTDSTLSLRHINGVDREESVVAYVDKHLGGIENLPNLVKKNELEKDELNILYAAYHMEGNIRQYATTAAGVIVSKEKVGDYCAIMMNKKGKEDRNVAAFNKEDAETIGFVKIDALNLMNIKIIHTALNLIKDRHKINLREKIWNLPLEDDKMIEEFSKGNTRLIFQYGGRALRDLMTRMEPKTYMDIVAANSLVRPGADDNEYIARMKGKEFEYPHPITIPFLEETYGLPIYQEQVMNMCRHLGRMRWQDVQRVRKMMGKKDTSEAEDLERIFVHGCVENGLAEHSAHEIWGEIEKHGHYSFNKAHCVSYFLVGWANMYLQVYYPVEWIAANLMVRTDDESLYEILYEMHRMKNEGVDIQNLPVDVNTSGEDWELEGTTIKNALTLVPHVGVTSSRAIVKKRGEDGEFKDLEDMQDRLTRREFNSRVETNLMMVGAIPGKRDERYDEIQETVINGNPFNPLDFWNVNKLHNPIQISQFNRAEDQKVYVMPGYLKSCRKDTKGDYRLCIHGDEVITLWSKVEYEKGPYVFYIDPYRYSWVYGADPMDEEFCNALFHPLFEDTHPSEFDMKNLKWRHIKNKKVDIKVSDLKDQFFFLADPGVTDTNKLRKEGMGFYLGRRDVGWNRDNSRSGNAGTAFIWAPTPQKIWLANKPTGSNCGIFWFSETKKSREQVPNPETGRIYRRWHATPIEKEIKRRANRKHAKGSIFG